MHRTIVEHTSRDRGYNEGVEAGKKIAFDLIGEMADWYKKKLKEFLELEEK